MDARYAYKRETVDAVSTAPVQPCFGPREVGSSQMERKTRACFPLVEARESASEGRRFTGTDGNSTFRHSEASRFLFVSFDGAVKETTVYIHGTSKLRECSPAKREQDGGVIGGKCIPEGEKHERHGSRFSRFLPL